MLIGQTAFGGMVLKDEPHLIPETASTYARNCDLRTHAATSLKGLGSSDVTIPTNVKSLFTINGFQFFTWNEVVFATKAPTINDTYSRVYYADSTGPRVTQSRLALTTGGVPSESWRIGVPVPTLAALTLSDLTSLPDGLSLVFKFFYEEGGIRFQEQTVATTMVTLGREYTFTIPDRDGATGLAGTSVTITDYYNGGWRNVGTTERPQQATVIGPSSIQLVPQGTVISGISSISADELATNSTLAAAWSAVAGNDKTPISAIPVIMLQGMVDGKVAITAYSDNSAFLRSDQPVKMSLKEGTATTMKVLLEWGTGGVFGKDTTRRNEAYVVTFMNSFGEESGPSLPMTTARDYLQRARLQITVPADAGQYKDITKVRCYRTVADAENNYFLCGEQSMTLAAGSTVYFDVPAVSSAVIGQSLESTTRRPPPTDCKGALLSAFGSVILWRENELWVSESYRGHAFSPDYVVTFPNNIITARVTAFGIMVWTTAGVWTVTGASPKNLFPQRIPIRQTVVSEQAIAVYENSVVFASPDGLVTVRGSDATLAPFLEIMTRDQWRDKYAARFSTLTMGAHDGYVVGMFSTGDGFMIRLDEGAGSMIEHGINGNSFFYFPQTDELYVGGSPGITKWATGSQLAWQYQSRVQRTGKPVNFGALRVRGSGTVTVTVIGDGVTIGSYAVSLTDAGVTVRLPTGRKAQFWRINVDGTAGAKLLGNWLAGIPAELSGA